VEDEGAGRGGTAMRLYNNKIVVAAQVEKEAEDPSPAPTGRVERAVKLKAGLT
jgi:hypothetical protein